MHAVKELGNDQTTALIRDAPSSEAGDMLARLKTSIRGLSEEEAAAKLEGCPAGAESYIKSRKLSTRGEPGASATGERRPSGR